MAIKWKLYWLTVGLMITNYLTMVLWSLPKLANWGGSTPFDMRPGGYTFEEAQGFINGLGEAGRAFYLGTQHVLDTAYPALLGIVLVVALIKLGGKPFGWIFAVFALAGSVFDYLENFAVSAMLKVEPDLLTAELVEIASRWTVFKSVSSSIAFTGLLVLGGYKAFVHWKGRNNSAS